MTPLGWLVVGAGEVPAGDSWLSDEERRVQSGLRFERRRSDWRLGRFVAKRAVARELGVALREVGIRAAPDGAPEAFVAGRPAGVAVSISHRGGHGLAVVGPDGAAVGGDVELVEPRSAGFVADWCNATELAAPSELTGDRDRLVALLWSAKEATSKVRRQGLRLDLRRVVVTLGAGAHDDGWHPWTAVVAAPTPDGPVPDGSVPDGPDGATGWWRQDGHRLITVAAATPTPTPRRCVGGMVAAAVGP
jgi:4'-phosphopantetheinyl transferase